MTVPILPTLEEVVDRYYEDGDRTRKMQSYLTSYARFLEDRRQEPLAVLELGVSSGASLLCWHDYLPNATIVGIDIAEPPARILGRDRIHFFRGGQDDPVILNKAAQAGGRPFDLIIDDASHIGYLTKRAMHFLFPLWLAPGGWYVIEDFGTGFLPEYPDGVAFSPPEWNDAQPDTREFRSSQFGMVGVVKQLIDHLMQDLMTGEPSYYSIQRVIIETNIAFIEKSPLPGGAWPGQITDLSKLRRQTAPGSLAAAASQWASIHEAIADHSTKVADLSRTGNDHAARIEELEGVIDRLRRGFAPVLWLRRRMRR